MASTNATINIAVNGQAQLEKLQAGLDKTHRAFAGLKTGLAGIGFAALGRSALTMADDLQDLSNATGIAVGRLIEFKKALVTSGGEADKMPQAINQFVRSIDEAAQGSVKAQNAFRDAGISLNDLRTLGEQDLMVKTLEGIARIEDPSRRAALMMDKFGKSFKSVDPGELAQKLRDTAGSGDKYAESVRRAAELNDALAEAAGNVKLAFLEAFAPLITKINEFNKGVNDSKDSMNTLIGVIKGVGIALAIAFAASLGTGLVAMIGQIGRGVMAVAGLAGMATGQGIFRAAGPHMVALRGIVVLISTLGTAIAAANLLFDDFGSTVANVFARCVEALGSFVAEILNFPTDAIAGILNLFGANIKDPIGLGTPVKMLVEQSKKAREAYEATVKAQKEATKPQSKASKEQQEAVVKRDVDTTAIDNQIKGIRQIGEEYDRNNKRINDSISLETDLIGKSKEYADITKAQADAAKRTEDAINNLTDAKAKMSKDDKESGMGKYYDEQIAKVTELGAIEQKRLAELLAAQNKAQAAEQLRNYSLQSQISLQNQLQGLQDDMAKMGLSSIEKKYYDIEAAAKASAKAAVEAEAQRRGIRPEDMPTDEVQKYYDVAQKGVDDLKKKTGALYDESRKFSTGWKDAFNEYVENATNAADQAKRMFETFTRSMEDTLVTFFKTGKLGWKDFLGSMVDMLIRSQVQQLMMKTFGGLGSVGGTDSGGGGLMKSIGNLLGFANGGVIPTNGPVIVGERGPELLSGAAGRTVTPNTALAGGQVTYNINAVDAMSFKQMLAQDPTFLHAVAEQGRRTLPGAR
jgi:lambda family phage tail tape measure protein